MLAFSATKITENAAILKRQKKYIINNISFVYKNMNCDKNFVPQL